MVYTSSIWASKSFGCCLWIKRDANALHCCCSMKQGNWKWLRWQMLESRCQQRALIASDASKGILLGLVLGMFSVIFSGWTASMTNMARNMCEQRLVVNYERGHPIFFFYHFVLYRLGLLVICILMHSGCTKEASLNRKGNCVLWNSHCLKRCWGCSRSAKLELLGRWCAQKGLWDPWMLTWQRWAGELLPPRSN